MQRNFSKRLEMQIPQENTYARLEILPDFNKEFEKLSKDYTLRKPNELKEYLKQDEQLIPYINTLTPLIREYFPENKKYLTFCVDPEFEELNRAKICVIGNDSLFEEEYQQMNELEKRILNLTEFPVQVKSLISVRMWWLWVISIGKNLMTLEII